MSFNKRPSRMLNFANDSQIVDLKKSRNNFLVCNHHYMHFVCTFNLSIKQSRGKCNEAMGALISFQSHIPISLPAATAPFHEDSVVSQRNVQNATNSMRATTSCHILCNSFYTKVRVCAHQTQCSTCYCN